MIYWTR